MVGRDGGGQRGREVFFQDSFLGWDEGGPGLKAGNSIRLGMVSRFSDDPACEADCRWQMVIPATFRDMVNYWHIEL